MYKVICLMAIFLIAPLTLIQFATADFLIANGSPTEDAWVIYSTWRDADVNWPAGFRTQGWYRVEPGGFRNLSVPEGNKSLYIRIERPGGVEVVPPDAATRDSFPFWIHPSQPFTVVENVEGDLLDSDFNIWNLEVEGLYTYQNGGRYTITTAECAIDMNLPVDQLYNQAMQSVLWIENLNEESQGSGVLIDTDRKLAVTNQHVVGKADFVFVSFPVRNELGELIGARDYYKDNWLSLALNGHGTWARVIAADAERDIAILQLDFLRENSREISHDFTTDVTRSISKNEVVHVLGNPGGQDLWRWTLGLFESDDGTWININADIYQGNSGGPVLNGRGKLIGIITLSNLRTRALAVPIRYVKALLDTVHPRHTIRITNQDNLTTNYEIKWNTTGNWTQYSVESRSSVTHWWSGTTLPTGYPQIRFNSDGVLSWGADTAYSIDAFLRYFGNDYRDHVTPYDAYEYIFNYNPSTRKVVLYRSDNEGCVPIDVNRDGLTNLQDLEYVAARIGSWIPGDADVDNDGDVDLSDVIFTAGLCTTAAAPSLNRKITPTLTAANLQYWINEGKGLGIDHPTFQRGLIILEQLFAAVTQVEPIPKETSLMPNYPNPFNPETWIPYQLAKPADVTVRIYAANGALVRTLDLGHQPAGVYQNRARAAYWDGKNTHGESVASGVYFYTFTAGDFSATQKMLIRK